MRKQLNWYVVHTTPKREKKVANQISNLGMEFFLPTYKTVKQWSDRKKKVEVPLFPNYVFVHTSERERHLLFSISNLVRFVSFESKPVKVREEEIQTVRRILEVDDMEIGEANYFETGSKVRISRGQLAGLEGRVLKNNGRSRLLIRIDELQKAFSINVSTSMLEPVGVLY